VCEREEDSVSRFRLSACVVRMFFALKSTRINPSADIPRRSSVCFEQDAVTMINTNCTAVVAITKLFVKGMIERDRGHIINMSSIAGKPQAYPGGTQLPRALLQNRGPP
jgi:NAD(P)-dependent dehydrogenase (short-subunit alcohol dehydrogenase family)